MMNINLIYLLYIGSYIVPTKCRHPDYTINENQVLQNYSQPFETHQVITQDGYIITFLRLIKENTTLGNNYAPPVLLVHGLGSTPVDFIYQKRALGFVLLNSGYDVWLANYRGDETSSHRTLSQRDLKFWDYSFHETGLYDIPAIIDHILKTTSQKKIFYIGHSMGTTMFFVMASERPEYNEKIRAMIALAPVAYCNNMQFILRPFLKLYPNIYHFLSQAFQIPSKLSVPRSIRKRFSERCVEHSPDYPVCTQLLMAFAGTDYGQLDPSTVPIIIGRAFNSGSSKLLTHFSQLVQNGKFRRFNYPTPELNEIRHQQRRPQDYNLSMITAPVSLHYGNNDQLVHEIDVNKLANALPNLIKKHLISWNGFNHLDFLYAKDVQQLLYDTVLEVMAAH